MRRFLKVTAFLIFCICLMFSLVMKGSNEKGKTNNINILLTSAEKGPGV